MSRRHTIAVEKTIDNWNECRRYEIFAFHNKRFPVLDID